MANLIPETHRLVDDANKTPSVEQRLVFCIAYRHIYTKRLQYNIRVTLNRTLMNFYSTLIRMYIHFIIVNTRRHTLNRWLRICLRMFWKSLLEFYAVSVVHSAFTPRQRANHHAQSWNRSSVKISEDMNSIFIPQEVINSEKPIVLNIF